MITDDTLKPETLQYIHHLEYKIDELELKLNKLQAAYNSLRNQTVKTFAEFKEKYGPAADPLLRSTYTIEEIGATTAISDINRMIRQIKQDFIAEIADTRNIMAAEFNSVRNEITSTLPLVDRTKKMEDIEAIDVHQEICDLYERLREVGFDI